MNLFSGFSIFSLLMSMKIVFSSSQKSYLKLSHLIHKYLRHHSSSCNFCAFGLSSVYLVYLSKITLCSSFSSETGINVCQ